MSPFNHFDLIAPYYDRLIKSNDLARFTKLVRLPTHGKLLDAGGGTGRKSFRLLGLVDDVVIADSSIGMLTPANKKGKLKLVCSETEHLPFLSEAFDRIIMIDALHHVVDYRFTLNELWHLLKPGGRLVIEEPDIRTSAAKFVAVAEKLLLMRSHFVSPQVVAGLFNYPDAIVNIEIENSTAWIIVDKAETQL